MLGFFAAKASKEPKEKAVKLCQVLPWGPRQVVGFIRLLEAGLADDTPELPLESVNFGAYGLAEPQS